MGKGDKKTKKGKIWRKSFGVRRPKKGVPMESQAQKKEQQKK